MYDYLLKARSTHRASWIGKGEKKSFLIQWFMWIDMKRKKRAWNERKKWWFFIEKGKNGRFYFRSGFNRHKFLWFQPSDIGHIVKFFFLWHKILWQWSVIAWCIHIFFFSLTNITFLVISSSGLDVKFYWVNKVIQVCSKDVVINGTWEFDGWQ